jgi:aryl-alcohol dehydrogenase-like predicted oxidoreductase
VQTLLANGFKVTAVGLGCMPMSHAYTQLERDDAESIRVIHRAIELGVTIFDTADVYGPYINEQLLGQALKGRRDEAVLATKCGLVPGPEGLLSRNGRPEHIQAACEDSLRRLGTDCIDIYQLHRVDPDVPLAETWGAMAELVRAGKVRWLGICHASVEQLQRAHAVHPITSVQYELAIWAPYARDDVLPWCREHGVTFLAFSPLGRGFLTGTLVATRFPASDSRSRDPRFSPEAMAANARIVEGLRPVAERHEATLAQVALAWVLAQGDQVVPIPGTKKRCWLEQNAAAVHLQLTDEDLRLIDALPEPVGRQQWT